MSVKIAIPAPMRQHTAGKSIVEVPAGTVHTVLDELCKLYPAMSQRLFKDGQLQRYMNLYLNDEDVRFLDGLTTPVNDGSELRLLPGVSGG